MGTDEPVTRRRRRRATAPQGAPQPPPQGLPEPAQQAPDAPAIEHDAADQSARRRRTPRDSRPHRDGGARGLRDLVGAGPSQIGVSGALRGRDVNRPTEQDLAEAERDLVIVQRHWKPDDPH